MNIKRNKIVCKKEINYRIYIQNAKEFDEDFTWGNSTFETHWSSRVFVAMAFSSEHHESGYNFIMWMRKTCASRQCCILTCSTNTQARTHT